MKNYKKFFAIIMIFCVTIAFSACGTNENGESIQQDTIVVALSGQVLQLDPGVPESSNQGTVNQNLYDPLYFCDAEGNFTPALAESYDVSEDGCVWTFHLRRGVKFHSGKEMNADDVVATFQRIIHKNDGVTVTDFDGLIDAQKINDYTVNLITEMPIGNFMNLIAHSTGVILNSDVIANQGDQIGTVVDGTGPYKLTEFETGDHIYMEANEDYWGGAPEIKKVKLLYVSEASTRLNMVLSGEAQFAESIANQDVAEVESSDIAKVRYDETNRVAHVGFNCKWGPFKDTKVRQAINYAIDRTSLTTGIMGESAEPCDSVIASNVIGYVSGEYEYNPVKAKELLSEAGYADGFEFTLWTPDGRYLNDKKTCLAFADQLKAVGVKCNVETVDWATLLEKIRMAPEDTDCQAYFMGWECTSREAGYTLKTLFLSTVQAPDGWNTMFYANPKVDELYEKAIGTTDIEKRTLLLKDAISICNEGAAWAPLYVYELISGQDKALVGVEILPNQEIRFGKARFE